MGRTSKTSAYTILPVCVVHIVDVDDDDYDDDIDGDDDGVTGELLADPGTLVAEVSLVLHTIHTMHTGVDSKNLTCQYPGRSWSAGSALG